MSVFPVADGVSVHNFASALVEAAAVLHSVAAVAAESLLDAVDYIANLAADERVASESAAVDWDSRIRECATYPAVVGVDI